MNWRVWGLVAAIVVAFLVLPFGGLFLYGLFLSPEYSATATGVIEAERGALFQTLVDPEQQGDWRPGVSEAVLDEPIEGDPVVVLHTGETKLTLRRTEQVPPERVVWTVVPSRKHVFQGHWTYELAEAPAGTRVTITEIGRIDSPFARAASHALFGMDTFVTASLRALARRHRAEVTVEGAD